MANRVPNTYNRIPNTYILVTPPVELVTNTHNNKKLHT